MNSQSTFVAVVVRSGALFITVCNLVAARKSVGRPDLLVNEDCKSATHILTVTRHIVFREKLRSADVQIKLLFED